MKVLNPLVIKINKLIDSGELVLENPPCLCSSERFRKIADRDWLGLRCSVVLCKECGLVFTRPRLSEPAYRRLYENDDYRELHTVGDFRDDARGRFASGQGEHILEFISPHLTVGESTTILEVGCGAGWNLEHFRKIGAKVIGYDLSRGLIELGQKEYQLDIRLGSCADAARDSIRADLVILNHVLEHFTDIPSAINIIKQTLKPGGLIYIGVPNVRGFDARQVQLAHTYYFSRATLRHYLGRYGLNSIAFGPTLDIHMHGIFVPAQAAEVPSISLRDEYDTMVNIVRCAKFKEYCLRMLNAFGLKSLVKRSLGR